MNFIKIRPYQSLLSGLLILCTPTLFAVQKIFFPNCNPASLIEDIHLANKNPGGGEIRLPDNCAYNLNHKE